MYVVVLALHTPSAPVSYCTIRSCAVARFAQSQPCEHVCSLYPVCNYVGLDVALAFVCMCDCVSAPAHRARCDSHVLEVYVSSLSHSLLLFVWHGSSPIEKDFRWFFVKCSRNYQTSFSSKASVQPIRRTFCYVLFRSKFIFDLKFFSFWFIDQVRADCIEWSIHSFRPEFIHRNQQWASPQTYSDV